MARYVTWLDQLGTIKASILRPYMSAVSGFFKDHGLEVVTLGDLVAEVRK
jgi:maleate cis-trans isomerase